jgi:hypothetical protein
MQPHEEILGMTLSNCHFCNHYADLGCSQNPDYHRAFSVIQDNVNDTDQTAIANILSSCEHWEQNPNKIIQTATVSMGMEGWKYLVEVELPKEGHRLLETLLLEAQKLIASQGAEEATDFKPSQIQLPPVPNAPTQEPCFEEIEPPDSPITALQEADVDSDTYLQRPLEQITSLEDLGEFWEEPSASGVICSTIRRGSGRKGHG